VEQFLTQEEIDRLLEQLQKEIGQEKGQEEKGDRPKNVRVYDFRHPDRLTRDMRRILGQIHDSFSREAAAYLNDRLRADVAIHVVSLDQLALADFFEGIQSPTCLYVLELKPHARSIVFELQPEFAFFTVDRILGGPGRGDNLKRELTKIEQILMEKIVRDISRILKSSWNSVASFDVQIQHFFSNAAYLQFAESGESVITVAFECNIDENRYLFGLTYPYFLIEKLVPVFEKENGSEVRRKPSPKERKILEQNLKEVTAPVSVYLGKTRLSIQEILTLKTGDVILLDRRTDEPLELAIGKRPRFLGRAGLYRNRLAFKITERMEE